jgi:hypothetical protein
MKRTFVLMIVAATLAGCSNMNQLETGLNPDRGTSRNLGDVSYPQAFAAARETLAQYFSIRSADPAAGIIRTRPREVDPGRERLLGGSPARQIATLQLTRENEQVIAQVVVQQQRQGSAPTRQMGYSVERYNYSGNPGDETPASTEAATTAEQNEAWTNEKLRHDVESTILNDLYKKMHGGQ